MKSKAAAVLSVIFLLCSIAPAEDGSQREFPSTIVFPASLPIDSLTMPEAPSFAPFRRAGFVVEEASWNNRLSRISRFSFPAHSLHNPHLLAFREKYDFLEHIEKGESEFERLLLMRQWINQRVATDIQNLTTLTDPFAILDRAAEGDGFVCTQFAALMQACATAAGWNSVVVHIDHDHNRNEPAAPHVVAEVWVHEFAKWVIFDTMYDCHYEKDGVPLSAIELQAEYLRNGGADVKPVVGVERTEVARARRLRRLTRGEASGYFWIKHIWGWNPFNQFGSKAEDMQLSYITDAHEGRVWWQGFPPNTYVLHAIQRGALIQTRRAADVNPDIGICEIRFHLTGREGAVWVNVNTFMPAFESLMVSFNGGDYNPVKSAEEFQSPFIFEWELREGENRMSVRARNEFGVMSRPTEVRVVLRRE